MSAKDKWVYTGDKLRTIHDLPSKLREQIQKVVERNEIIKKHREFEK